jgi:hypothetical protein
VWQMRTMIGVVSSLLLMGLLTLVFCAMILVVISSGGQFGRFAGTLALAFVLTVYELACVGVVASKLMVSRNSPTE